MLKLAVMKIAEPTNEAKVSVASDVVTPAEVPAKDAEAHKIQSTKIQIFPKLKISVSFVPSGRRRVNNIRLNANVNHYITTFQSPNLPVRKNVQKLPRKIIDKLIKIGPLHKTNPLAQPS